jgi:hypothetical protein
MNQLKKENQLETLCQAIEYGLQSDKLHPTQYQPTDCVLVPRGAIDGEEPQVIACRLWRWSDLYTSHAIKRIPSCPNEKDPVYVCCNPAHWSRIYHLGKKKRTEQPCVSIHIFTLISGGRRRRRK